MRVSKEKAAENRTALLDAASKLFRKNGIDGVGVAEVAKEAGLTHGALYAHFESKDALAAAAFSTGFAGNMAAMRAWAGDRKPTFEEYITALLSTSMRDKLATGCPMTASASEAGRQGAAVSQSFVKAFEEEVALLAGPIDPALRANERRLLAIASVAAQIGAISVARAVAKASPALSDEILRSVRELIMVAYRSRTEER